MKLANYIDFNFIYTDRVKLNAKVIASACHNQYDKYNYVVQCFQKSKYQSYFTELRRHIKGIIFS